MKSKSTVRWELVDPKKSFYPSDEMSIAEEAEELAQLTEIVDDLTALLDRSDYYVTQKPHPLK